MSAPLSVPHFRAWAAELVLDTGALWRGGGLFCLFLGGCCGGVPEAWWVVPEGNSKTAWLAGLGVYLLEHRAFPAIPWAASSRDQAEIGYRQAEGFVMRSPRLAQFMKCQEGYRRIKNMANG